MGRLSTRARRRWLLILASAGVLLALRVISMAAADPAAEPATEGTYQRGDQAELAQLIDQLRVLERRPNTNGYDRECGTGHGCSFGQRWSDDVDVEFGHNGCDTRNDLLRHSMENVEIRPGTNGCVVEAGTLSDPYTGRTIQFLKSRAHDVQVDHVYPLARAWDMGANNWSLKLRQAFANDPRNLIVADGPANASKSDQGPGEWLPINAAYRCTYVARYLEVAAVYQLPITSSDLQAAELAAQLCK